MIAPSSTSNVPIDPNDEPLIVLRNEPRRYTVQREFGARVHAAVATTQLQRRLLVDGPADEEVYLRFEGNVGIEAIFATHSPGPESVGWIGLLLPFGERRQIRLPNDFTVTADASLIDHDVLASFRPDGPAIVADSRIDLTHSAVIRRGDETVGWAPVMRISSNVSSIPIVIIHPAIFADDPRRLTHLRLAVFSRVLEMEFARGHSVLSWLRDNGDPVNDYKRSVASAAKGTHWMGIRVRRDLDSLHQDPCPEAP
ncbi:MAG: hypothetical protein RJB01_1763 [Actinomycetota bacterium]|jgi:hypothetical protein